MDGTMASPGQLYVRALYDYAADDRTSLSFQTGDIIQVITQLESGWWDGVINGVRGWFPSNYCAVVSTPYEDGVGNHFGAASDSEMDESEDEYAERNTEHIANGGARNHGNINATAQEEAAFWIPQATPEGQLYYFNTLTGRSVMELPLEAPMSPNETGPRDRTNVYIPNQTRPPAELMAGGYERDEDTDYASASEAEDTSFTRDSKGSSNRRRRSLTSDGVSPATSMDSLSAMSQSANAEAAGGSFSAMHQGIPPIGTTMTSFANAPADTTTSAALPRRFFDDTPAVPLTWDTMLEDVRHTSEKYRECIDAREKSEYTRRVEDMSDAARLILSAASGTTDSYSGNPSLPANTALYPRYREMMSRFSKLVITSHIAAADFPSPEFVKKCLHENDLFLNGALAFIDVARKQRGEEISRLTPGFVSGSTTAGSWKANGLAAKDPMANMSFIDDELDATTEPTVALDKALLDRMQELKGPITISLRRLDQQLGLRDKLITPQRHIQIADEICNSAKSLVDVCRPYLSTIESVDLAPLNPNFQNPQLNDFAEQKQKLYDATSDFIIACQAVAAPLGDEWAHARGSPMDDRLNRVRNASRDLDIAAGQVLFSMQILAEIQAKMSPPANAVQMGGRHPESSTTTQDRHLRNQSSSSRAGPSEAGPSLNGIASPPLESSKVPRFFGESPASAGSGDSSETPSYLRLDHEGEIAYDVKVDPPQLRGGTLTGLVEQLTRHDRLDSPFNNTFLLTYRSFTSAPELFEMLVRRWTIQPPYGLSGTELQAWVDQKQKLIKLRVVNILKSWFDNYWMEPYDDASKRLMQEVYKFAKDTVQPTSAPIAGPLMAAIELRMRGQEASSKRLVMTMPEKGPAPILPKNMKKLKFLDIDPLEFARQLTVIEFKLYGKIKHTECLNKAWQKKLEEGEPDPAENLKSLIFNSNQLTNWVAQLILGQADVKRRVVVIKHWVAIAEKCRQLNNFSCLTSIISAMGSAPVHRLTRTWTQVNTKTMVVLEGLRTLMGSTKNFVEYRETLHKANPPCIPFFGIYLTDLTFIEDGIPSVIKKTNLINFAKRAKTAEVIRDIQQYQNVPYQLQPVPDLQEHIQRSMQGATDVHEMYEKSLTVEPREREDEKIARLLSESGFL